jgi:hypothetical protein
MRAFIGSLVALALAGLATAAADEFDVILRRGTIVDGTGLPRYARHADRAAATRAGMRARAANRHIRRTLSST